MFCAAAMKVNRTRSVSGNVFPSVRFRGHRFREALRAIECPSIGNVRGLGLMLGVELIDAKGQPATDLAIRLMKSALRDGLLLLADSPASNVLSFSPPFSITDEEMDFVANWLQRALGESHS